MERYVQGMEAHRRTVKGSEDHHMNHQEEKCDKQGEKHQKGHIREMKRMIR